MGLKSKSYDAAFKESVALQAIKEERTITAHESTVLWDSPYNKCSEESGLCGQS